ADHGRSWVMLKKNGEIEPLEDETIVVKTPDHVSLELRVPQGLRTANPNFSLKCDDGVAYVTNKRIIYLAARPTAAFQSFSAFILDTYDPQPRGGGWLGFGAWRWKAEATPRSGGGIPADIPRIELTLIFNNGGIDAYHGKYCLMYERLDHARDVSRETGASITVHDDELPAYTPAGARGASVQAGPSSSPETPAPSSGQPQQSPNEPPPGYDEAQAQAVEQQFDERERQDAERAQ
ncbi:hypothetical protein BD289DRAFT_373057, partial [Coniella lustricola]